MDIKQERPDPEFVAVVEKHNQPSHDTVVVKTEPTMIDNEEMLDTENFTVKRELDTAGPSDAEVMSYEAADSENSVKAEPEIDIEETKITMEDYDDDGSCEDDDFQDSQDASAQFTIYKFAALSAAIKLQTIVDLTTSRLCESLTKILLILPKIEKQNLRLVSKWGCDANVHVLQSSFVPLELFTLNKNGHKKIFWENPKPSLVRYCRPIRFCVTDELTRTINEEVDYVKSEINLLRKTEVQSPKLLVEHIFLYTEGSSLENCSVCRATIDSFNNLDTTIEKEIKPEFRLSIFQASIQFFKSILELSYKLPLTKFKLDTEKEKEITENQKTLIHKQLRSEIVYFLDTKTGILGDSRRFFSEYDTSAKITGFNEELLYRYRVILETISSHKPIDRKKFGAYTLETAKLYVNLYPWYPMPSMVHEMLVHGEVMLSSGVLPIDQLTDEIMDLFETYQNDYKRPLGKKACGEWIMKKLLLNSDPLITSLRKVPKKKLKHFSKEAVELFLPEDDSPTVTDSEDEYGSEDE